MTPVDLLPRRGRSKYWTSLVVVVVVALTGLIVIPSPRATYAAAPITVDGASLAIGIPIECVNALCNNGSLANGSTPQTDARPIVICSQIPCTGTEPGFRDVIRTPDSWAAWGPLQALAISELSTLHAVPVDKTRMLTWDRDELKAYILTDLIRIIDTPASKRTQEDKVAYDRLERLVKAARLQIAQRAKQEYNAWAVSGGCNWSPPPGFDPVPHSLSCHGAPIAVDFHFSPSAEQFTEYATYYLYTDKFKKLGEADAMRAARGMALALGYLGGVMASAAAGFAAWGIATSAGVSFAAFSSALATSAGLGEAGSLAAEAIAATTAAQVAAAPAVSAASIGGLVGIALAGAVGVVIASIQFADTLQVPGKLDQAIDEASNDVDLPGFVGAPTSRHEDNVKLLGLLFSVETLPDTNSDLVAAFTAPKVNHDPKKGLTDPRFKLEKGQVSDQFESMTWDGKRQTTYVWNGWFVNEVEGGKWMQALTIEFIDQFGRKAHAGILGGGFSQGVDGDPGSAAPTTTLRFRKPNGSSGSATWWGNEPPTVQMAAQSASGSYVAGQPITFHSNAHDPNGDRLNYVWAFEPDKSAQPTLKPGEERARVRLVCKTSPTISCPDGWVMESRPDVVHTWTTPGTYHVGLVVLDANKQTAQQWMRIVIVAAPIVSASASAKGSASTSRSARSSARSSTSASTSGSAGSSASSSASASNSPEGSVKAATPAPTGSLANTAYGPAGGQSPPIFPFIVLTLAGLCALAWHGARRAGARK